MATKNKARISKRRFTKKQLHEMDKHLTRLKEIDDKIIEVGEGNLMPEERDELKRLREWREAYGKRLTTSR